MLSAAIDIGTNTFHLLIGEIEAGKIKVIYTKTIAVKLGEGGINKREIMPAAYQRGLKALAYFAEVLKEYEITQVKATATAAVRDASNGLNFINDVYELCKIQIEIINGHQEALFIYEGARASGAIVNEKCLVMDIGGGSVEFILCNQQKVFWKNSYRIGAARLLADFYHHDPLEEKDINNINNHFINKLKDLEEACKEHQPTKLIGTAGAFDSYREIFTARGFIKPHDDVWISLENQKLADLIDEIIASNHNQRSQIEGLIPLRVDMILMASMIVKYVIKELQIEKIIACEYALKEGLLTQQAH
ncbi:exopolyphosphatase [Pedobacter aquae]|uniref:Exopolyphosphatase n=1 Tax=Pedobacter aquae TaxID=2605747 RepID=A0A5C0VI16_9SPHI|nr:exopolyphosphatase [Pedobacter aquae]QEK51452.1 exopolyphosphatase [Pedobacter aquae]